MRNNLRFFTSTQSIAVAALLAGSATAAEPKFECKGLPTHAQLSAALKAVVTAGNNGGFGLNMWATIVNRDGEVCSVAFSGTDRGDQWPGSRVISAQKANTANSFSSAIPQCGRLRLEVQGVGRDSDC